MKKPTQKGYVNLNIRMNVDDKLYLQKLAEEDNRPMQYICEMILTAYIEKDKAEKAKTASEKETS